VHSSSESKSRCQLVNWFRDVFTEPDCIYGVQIFWPAKPLRQIPQPIQRGESAASAGMELQLHARRIFAQCRFFIGLHRPIEDKRPSTRTTVMSHVAAHLHYTDLALVIYHG